jgi:hypothetical protein
MNRKKEREKRRELTNSSAFEIAIVGRVRHRRAPALVSGLDDDEELSNPFAGVLQESAQVESHVLLLTLQSA